MHPFYRSKNIRDATGAANWCERLQRFITGILAAMPLIAAIHFRWIDLVIPAAVAALVIMAATAPDYRRAVEERWTLNWRNPIVLFATASAAWMALSVFWAPNVHRAAFGALQAAGIVGGALTLGVVVKSIPQERLFPLLVKLTFAAVVVAAVGSIGVKVLEHFGIHAPLASDIRGAAPKLILFVWPCLGWLAQQRRASEFVLLLILAVLLVAVSSSGAAGLAVAGATVVIGIGQARPRFAIIAPLLLLLFGFLAAPLLSKLEFILHWPHVFGYLARFEPDQRIHIWTFYGNLFWQHSWIGFGFRAERFFDASLFPSSIPAEGHLHPHNEPLQVLLEFGIVGAALLLATLALVTRALWRDERREAVYVAACIAAFLCEGFVNFSLWESWWLAVIAIAFVFSARLLDKPDFTPRARAMLNPSAPAATL